MHQLAAAEAFDKPAEAVGGQAGVAFQHLAGAEVVDDHLMAVAFVHHLFRNDLLVARFTLI